MKVAGCHFCFCFVFITSFVLLLNKNKVTKKRIQASHTALVCTINMIVSSVRKIIPESNFQDFSVMSGERRNGKVRNKHDDKRFLLAIEEDTEFKF